MASSPSRIPVPAHHSRIPVVLGSALPPVASSGITSSSSMPSVAFNGSNYASVLTAGETSTPAAAAATSSSPTARTGTMTSAEDNTAHSIWQDAVIDDQAWGKIERLRTRRVFSEGYNRASPPTFARTSSHVATSPMRDRQREIDYNSSAPQSSRPSPVGPSSTARVPSSRSIIPRRSTERIHREPALQPDSKRVGDSDQPPTNADGKPRSPSSPNSTIRTFDARHEQSHTEASSNKKSTFRGESHDNRSTSAAKSHYPARTKLMSGDVAEGIGLLALGFRDTSSTVKKPLDHRLAPLERNSEVPEDRRTVATRSQRPVEDHAAHNRELTMFKAHATGQPTRSTIQTSHLMPQSQETLSADYATMARGVSAFPREIALNSPEMLDAQASEHSLPRIPDVIQVTTTARKRHQPQLRLAFMPSAPVFHAAGIEISSRSPGSGGSPPIPAKNPLRKRSSVGAATLGSQASTPGLSSISTCNPAQGNPGERSEANSQDEPYRPSEPTAPPLKITLQAETKPSVSRSRQAASESTRDMFPQRLHLRDDDWRSSRTVPAQRRAEGSQDAISETSSPIISVSSDTCRHRQKRDPKSVLYHHLTVGSAVETASRSSHRIFAGGFQLVYRYFALRRCPRRIS